MRDCGSRHGANLEACRTTSSCCYNILILRPRIRENDTATLNPPCIMGPHDSACTHQKWKAQKHHLRSGEAKLHVAQGPPVAERPC
jgi:hypothetical protein